MSEHIDLINGSELHGRLAKAMLKIRDLKEALNGVMGVLAQFPSDTEDLLGEELYVKVQKARK